ncbi:hypothetical protein J6590_070262 [Homalodisca vitripennis]|nr:hypothetical protein J6590_070262 [Homalodisca vitripennis]
MLHGKKAEQLSANANKNEERETAQVRTPKTALTPGHLHARRGDRREPDVFGIASTRSAKMGEGGECGE